MNEAPKQFGLKELPPDPRDFKLGAAFSLPLLSDLPDEFLLESPFPVKNQGDSDLCTAYATCGASELQEKVELCPEYSFALSKELSGDPDAWGQDLRVAMKAHVKVGAIAQSEFATIGVSTINPRYIGVWPPSLKTKALEHAKSSFMDVLAAPYDPFDNIRAAMWKFRDEKRAVVLGLKWGWPITDQFLIFPLEGTGHAVYAIGCIVRGGITYLVIQNSFGPEAGDRGRFYVSRAVINAYAPKFGAFMFTDMTREEYLERLKPAVQLSILDVLKKLLSVIFPALIKFKAEEKAPEPRTREEMNVMQKEGMDEPLPESTPLPPESTQDMVRRVCRQENLSEEMSRRVFFTIRGESGFRTDAVNPPLTKPPYQNGSRDYGICQFNTSETGAGWYGKLITPTEALNEPEKAVRLMARQFKAGRASDWIVYRILYPEKVVTPFLGGMKIPYWLLSSSGHGLAERWKSFAVGVIPAAVLVSRLLGHPIDAETGSQFVDLIVDALNAYDGVVAAVVTFGTALWHIKAWAEANFRKKILAGKFDPRFRADYLLN